MSGQRIGRSAGRGPTKPRRTVGELQGPPPDVSRQVRHVLLKVEQLDDGRWRFSMPRQPGWVTAASHPGEVTAAIRRSFTEAQVGAYSKWRGTAYDAGLPEYRRTRPTAASKRRCDVYAADMWVLTGETKTLPDGSESPVWVSPRGLRFSEATQCVQRVMRNREAAGLSARPDPVAPGSAVGSLSARAPVPPRDELTGQG